MINKLNEDYEYNYVDDVFAKKINEIINHLNLIEEKATDIIKSLENPKGK